MGESESHSVLSDTLQPHGLYSSWNSLGQNTGVGSLSLLQGVFQIQWWNPGFTLQADSLPAEPPGKPKNTGVGILSLLQRIFPAQELYLDLLHCRQILYRLNYREQNQDLNLCRSSSKACGVAFVYITAVNVHETRYKIVTHASDVWQHTLG